jgi:hypothetical protein
MIRRASRVTGKESLFNDTVPVQGDGVVRFVVPDEDNSAVLIPLFRLGLEAARINMKVEERIEVETAPRASCDVLRQILNDTQRPFESESSWPLNSVISEWLTGGAAALPLLQVVGSNCFAARLKLTITASRHGMEFGDGSLVYLAAEEASAVLRDESDVDGKNKMRSARCLVLQGLAKGSSDWSTVLNLVAVRAGFGMRTLLLDREEPLWLNEPCYRDRLGYAIRIVHVDSGNSPVIHPQRQRPSNEGAAVPADREAILLAARVVARIFGVNPESLQNRHSNREESTARQAAIYVVRKWKRVEYRLIGKVLGGRTQVGAQQAFSNIEQRCRLDAAFAALIQRALAELDTVSAVNYSVPSAAEADLTLGTATTGEHGFVHASDVKTLVH